MATDKFFKLRYCEPKLYELADTVVYTSLTYQWFYMSHTKLKFCLIYQINTNKCIYY